MTAFGKLIRTTAFRLTLVYLFLFALFAASLLGYFAWNTRRLITEQITTTVNAEDRRDHRHLYAPRPARPCSARIGNRALRPGANLYLVTTPEGMALGGNVASLSPGVMGSTGWSETAYRRLDEQDTADHRALVLRHRTQQRFPPAGRPRSRRTPPAVRHRRQRRAMVAAGRHRARHRRRHLRGAAGAAADRRHDRHHPAHHGRRPLRTACRSGAAATNSIDWRKTSMRCWSGSRP